MRKVYYNTKLNGGRYKIEVMNGDIVKLEKSETLYKIIKVNRSNFFTGSYPWIGCCVIRNETFTEGYDNIESSNLVFVDRKFHDPDHF